MHFEVLLLSLLLETVGGRCSAQIFRETAAYFGARRVSVFKSGRAFALFPRLADTVATGEVDCYNSTPFTPQLYGDDRPEVY